jgi:hypothetical protein
MTNPLAQNLTPELPDTMEVTRPEWVPPQLDKLPIAETAAAGTGTIADGFDFSS